MNFETPNNNKDPLRINDGNEGKNGPKNLQNLPTIAEVSSTEVKDEVSKEEPCPHWKNKPKQQSTCDKEMQTDN